jgi:hypothetical protein
MRIDKLTGGVLRVVTPLGPRYIRPSFAERLHLLWMFRNFQVLPQQVLSARQQRLIDDLCARKKYMAWDEQVTPETPILGTLERKPPLSVGRSESGYSVSGNLAQARQR